MADISYLSQEGFERLNAELDDLKTRGRQEAAKAIAEAREKGDLSENAEYHAAKDEQGHLERKINEREKALANARVLDPTLLDLSAVTVLTKVTIKNLKNAKEITYHLVAESEANLKERKISISSPIGEGLLGLKVGDVADIQTPGGMLQFEIMNISL